MSDNALGRGLDALIQPKSKSESQKKEKEIIKEVPTPQVRTTSSTNLSSDKIDEIKKEVEKNPRISLWSAKSAACLRYLKKTTPEFSISKEASKILEEAISEKYPEIWELFEE